MLFDGFEVVDEIRQVDPCPGRTMPADVLAHDCVERPGRERFVIHSNYPGITVIPAASGGLDIGRMGWVCFDPCLNHQDTFDYRKTQNVAVLLCSVVQTAQV